MSYTSMETAVMFSKFELQAVLEKVKSAAKTFE